MANDSSLVAGAGEFAFDLDSQKGVTHLLASLRASDLTSEEKNEVRDLVFLYANGGHDQSVRITIEQKIVAYGVLPVPTTAEPVSQQPAYPYGTSRPAPSFTVPPVNAQEKSDSAPQPTTPLAAPAVSSPQTPPVPTAPTPTQQATAPVQPSPASVQPTVASAPQPPASMPMPPTPPPAEPASVAYDPDQSLARIREIKALVNEKVGNPVNLIDIDNEVGREYMASLLDAMKKLNTGTSVVSAMQRLEDSYRKVETVLKNHQQEEQKQAQQRVVDATPPPKQTEDRSPVAVADRVADVPTTLPVSNESTATKTIPSPAPSVTVTPEQAVRPTIVSKPTPVPKPAPAPAPFPTPESKLTSESVSVDPNPAQTATERWQEQKPAEKPQVIPAGTPAPMPSPRSRSEVEAESAWGPATDTISPTSKEVNLKAASVEEAVSLADSKNKLKSLADLPEASSLETSSVEGDSLFTKEVDDGLQQLLSEWSLFKKSGLFGTGPKGREHPLFKKIASLQIPLLLAGRFEGATQETKQSITDYMNGWRYEQGIIYEPGETFEHYLRRVISHILDLQKNKRTS